ncbi:hypothetical protein CALCODRAFT_108428 [Calocera cornea HHB12733]|uniref:HAMP domain-containing protein n=1 Tax=Calocera cornea HHB12733 TaxID=1353952 RepID=A0A165IGX0_9BASI|nr:hypothetical protein CALCODRAFT_108428 [Calocera cornea HHB12733]
MGTAASHPLDQPLVAEESVDHAANVEAEPNDVQTQESSPPIYNQYMKYLATVLSDDPLGTPMLPKYDGPFDSQTDVVSHSLDGLLRRLRDAEEENKRLRANGASELSRNTAIPNQTFGTSEALTEPWLVVAPSAINEGGRDAAEDLKTLKAQMKEITRVCSSLASGDFTSSVSIEVQDPVMSDLKDSVNRMVDTARAVTSEVVKVCSDISEKGKLGISANIAGVKGSWLDLQIGVNQLADGATNTVRSVITTIKAIRGGDLTKTIDIQAQGEFLELKNTTNSMVTFLESFLSEMTRIPIEIGVMGVLGGEARVDGARGIWAKAVDSTNVRENLMQLDATETVGSENGKESDRTTESTARCC